MHPSSVPRALLLAVLLVAVFAVLFADILAVSAVADPLPASTGAVLTPISPSTLARPYSHSSFQITSRLLNGSGEPIPDARVSILQELAGTNQMQLIGSATMRADGSLIATVPTGASRLINLVYHASENEGHEATPERPSALKLADEGRHQAVRSAAHPHAASKGPPTSRAKAELPLPLPPRPDRRHASCPTSTASPLSKQDSENAPGGNRTRGLRFESKAQ